MPAYDRNNIFAKDPARRVPCYKVYEDDHVLAFLDIMPRSPGPYAGDPEGALPATSSTSRAGGLRPCRPRRHKIAAAAMKAFKADGITVQQFNEARRRTGGVPSAHARDARARQHRAVLPASRKEDVKVLEDNATKLIAALKGA